MLENGQSCTANLDDLAVLAQELFIATLANRVAGYTMGVNPVDEWSLNQHWNRLFC